MKLIFTAARVPEEIHVDATRWISNYNSVNVTRSDFYRLNLSDIIRISLKYFLDHHTPQKTFFPKR